MDDDKIDTLWEERESLIEAEEYEGEDDLQCTCNIEGVVCPIHPDRELLKEKELED